MDGSSGMSADEIIASYHLPRPMPLWLNPQYAKHIVKGNFMTLSARPKTVEQAEWIAHHGKTSLKVTVKFRAALIPCISGRALSQSLELCEGSPRERRGW